MTEPTPPTFPVTTKGLLLFAHGARDPRWKLPFDAVAEQARAARPGWQVELAFLEFMQPDLPTAGRRLVGTGCTEVDIVPLFLGAGGHVRKDLPALIERLAGEFPAVAWRLQPAVGEVPSVVAAMAQAAVASADPAGSRAGSADRDADSAAAGVDSASSSVAATGGR